MNGSARPLSGLPLAVILAMALLAVSGFQAMANLDVLFKEDSAMSKTLDLRLWGTPLGKAVSGFIVAQVVVHLLFGVMVWVLARLTELASPQITLRRWKLVSVWFCWLSMWTLVGSATLYPWSSAGIAASFWGEEILGTINLFEMITLITALALAALVFGALRSIAFLRRYTSRVALYSVLILAVAVLYPLASNTFANDSQRAPARPNIVLIGIDSLRPDVVAGSRRIGVTPNIDRFLRDGFYFSDAITPLARTFPSWISILSGQYPRHTGVRENLTAPSSVVMGDTLQGALRANGYATVYATDETRFSNIDQAYGFDDVIGPTMGAADFALAELNDLPLTNVLSNTVVSRYLFPATYANRAAAKTYRPETFVTLLDSRLEEIVDENEDVPLFLAMHLTLPHAPFHHAGHLNDVFVPSTDKLYAYLSSVMAADRQLGQVLDNLERRGILHNAIVVLMSDHGEALGRPGLDSVVSGAEGRGLLGDTMVNLWGHGTSVLSVPQYRVFLALRGYGLQLEGSTGREIHVPATLVDVEPTILQLLKAPPPQSDGLSLVPVLDGRESLPPEFSQRVRFTESGIVAPLDDAGDLDQQAVEKSAALFRMNSDNGRVELRADVVPLILAEKERAALWSHWLLAALPPESPEAETRLVLFDRNGSIAPRKVNHQGDEPAEIRSMVQALREHYGNELTLYDEADLRPAK